ncbi:MAG: hypothetical protein Q9P90_01810 [candidate division KSB1 bacterium]|nr:hypothetical protein [candidate division KSB1 bacterium]
MMVLIGLLYAPFDQPTGQSRIDSPAFRASAQLASLFVMLVLVSYALNPAWMWMYYVDPLTVSLAGLVYAVIGLYALPWIAGYALGLELIRRGRKAWLAAILVSLLVEGWLLVALWERYNCLANYLQFQRSECQPLIGSTAPLAIVLNVGGGFMVLAGGYFWWQLKRHHPRENS